MLAAVVAVTSHELLAAFEVVEDGGVGAGAVVEPARGNGPAGIDLPLQAVWGVVDEEVGVEAEGAERGELGLGACAVAVQGPDGVVLVVARNLAPEGGKHGAAGGEALAVASAAGVVVLGEVGNHQGDGALGQLRPLVLRSVPSGEGVPLIDVPPDSGARAFHDYPHRQRQRLLQRWRQSRTSSSSRLIDESHENVS